MLRANFSEFVLLMIREARNSWLFDDLGSGFQIIVDWTLVISCSRYRNFRIAATYSGMLILDALTDMVVELYGTGASLEFLQNHTESILDCERKILQTNRYIDVVFNGLFLHRCRDVDPGIRSYCIEHLSHWMAMYPRKFLDDVYLQHIGQSMFDEEVEPRAQAILSLSYLFSRSNFATLLLPGLRSFLDGCLIRIFDISIRDRDGLPQISALSLVREMLSMDILEALETLPFDSVWTLLLSPSVDVRRLCGDILALFLCQKSKDDSDKRRLEMLVRWIGETIFEPTLALDLKLQAVKMIVGNLRGNGPFSSILGLSEFLSFVVHGDMHHDGLVASLGIVYGIFSDVRTSNEDGFGDAVATLVKSWQELFQMGSHMRDFVTILLEIVKENCCCQEYVEEIGLQSREMLSSLGSMFSHFQRIFMEESDEYLFGISVCVIATLFGSNNLIPEKRNVLANILLSLQEQDLEQIQMAQSVCVKYTKVLEMVVVSASPLVHVLVRDYFCSAFRRLGTHFASFDLMHGACDVDLYLYLVSNASFLVLFSKTVLSQNIVSTVDVEEMKSAMAVVYRGIFCVVSRVQILKNGDGYMDVLGRMTAFLCELYLFLKLGIVDFDVARRVPRDAWLCLMQISEDLAPNQEVVCADATHGLMLKNVLCIVDRSVCSCKSSEYVFIESIFKLSVVVENEPLVLVAYLKRYGKMDDVMQRLVKTTLMRVSQCVDRENAEIWMRMLGRSIVEMMDYAYQLHVANVEEDVFSEVSRYYAGVFVCGIQMVQDIVFGGGRRGRGGELGADGSMVVFFEKILSIVLENARENVSSPRFLVFRYFNQHWTRYVRPEVAGVLYATILSMEGNLRFGARHFYDHYMQFKKFLARKSQRPHKEDQEQKSGALLSEQDVFWGAARGAKLQ